MKQQRLPGMTNIKPPRPTIRSEHVARRIAERLVRAVNLDDFYWEPAEIEDRIWDVQQEIMRAGDPAFVFCRLHEQQPIVMDVNDWSDGRGGHPYGWEGIDQHCRHIAEEIATEEEVKARREYRERYE